MRRHAGDGRVAREALHGLGHHARRGDAYRRGYGETLALHAVLLAGIDHESAAVRLLDGAGGLPQQHVAVGDHLAAGFLVGGVIAVVDGVAQIVHDAQARNGFGGLHGEDHLRGRGAVRRGGAEALDGVLFGDDHVLDAGEGVHERGLDRRDRAADAAAHALPVGQADAGQQGADHQQSDHDGQEHAAAAALRLLRREVLVLLEFIAGPVHRRGGTAERLVRGAGGLLPRTGLTARHRVPFQFRLRHALRDRRHGRLLGGTLARLRGALLRGPLSGRRPPARLCGALALRRGLLRARAALRGRRASARLRGARRGTARRGSGLVLRRLSRLVGAHRGGAGARAAFRHRRARAGIASAGHGGAPLRARRFGGLAVPRLKGIVFLRHGLRRLDGRLLGALGHTAAAAARRGRLRALRFTRRRGRGVRRLRHGRGGPLEGAGAAAHAGALIHQLLGKRLCDAGGRIVPLGAKIHGVLKQGHAALLHFRAERRGVLLQETAAHHAGLLPCRHPLRHLRGVHGHVPGSRILCRSVARRLEGVAGLIVIAVVVAQNVALLILGSVGWIRPPPEPLAPKGPP